MPIRLKVFLIIVVVVVAITMTGLCTSLFFINKSLTASLEHDLSFIVEVADGLISTKMQLIKTKAAHVAAALLRVDSPEEMSKIMAEHIAGCPDCISHSVLDRNGVIAQYGIPVSPEEMLLHSKIIERVYSEGVSILSDPFYSVGTGRLIMRVYTPFGADKIFALTQSGFLFADFIAAYKLWNTGNVHIINDEGMIIADPEKELVLQRNFHRNAEIKPDSAHEEDRRISEFMQNVLANEKGTGSYPYQGTEHIASYRRISGSITGWRVIVHAPLHESPKTAVEHGIVLSSLFLLALGITAAFGFSGLIEKPFKKLEQLHSTVSAQHARIRVLLDSSPLACRLWNKDSDVFECNEESLRLFGAKSKQELLARYGELYPAYQPDGMLSEEKNAALLHRAHQGEKIICEWTYHALDGTVIPAEITLVRVPFEGEYAVAVYTRDLREHMQIMQHLRASSTKLETIISNYSGIIWNVDKNNTVTLLNGLYIKKFGLSPTSFEGWSLDAALEKNAALKAILMHIQETADEGPQDWIYEDNGRTFHAHTTPIINDNGEVSSVMGVIDDISEITRLQAELTTALVEAQKANLAKSRFLANMSHEMRTPLNAVIGLSEISLEHAGLDDETRSNIEKIYNAGATLLNTVNDILDISKIEAGKLALVNGNYDLPSMINDAITQNVVRIGEKTITLMLDLDVGIPARLYGDELRVKQVLNNLLSNAIKYTREGTVTLRMRCVREGNMVWLTVSVQDTGIGISRENLGKLFFDYAQADEYFSRRIEGTGLGLSITKKIVAMMDGEITVESEYGKGSIFTARLKQQSVDNSVIDSETIESLKSFHYFDTRRNKHSLPRIQLPYSRVLVVDDNSTNLDVAQGLLKKYGMQVDCVISGQQAVEAIRREEVIYNAVFMDHMMPGMDGIEAARRIRETGTDYAVNIPIIALTANAIAGNEQMFLHSGFQDFLSKPINLSRLDAIVRRWVRDESKEEVAMLAADEPPGGGQPAGMEIPGVDIAQGIERFGGDGQGYLAVLRSYAVNTRPLLDAIATVTAANLQEYAVTVHGIKGSSRGICAAAVGEFAETLEKAAKAGNFVFVSENNADFLATVGNLLAEIENMLDRIEQENMKPAKDTPDGELLAQLADACDAYNMDRARELVTEMDKYRYASAGELVEWLKTNVSKGLFEEISDKLSTLRM